MTVNEAIDYIHSLSKFGKKSGLDNIRLLLNEMDNPQNDLKFVHIAGTNGKGSIANYISSALIESGVNTGLYTSPYIEKFNERIQLNGKNISDDDLITMTEYVMEKVKSIQEKNPDYHPIEFEVITAIGMEYFKRKKCEIVVLETGLGGKLDCTNVIEKPLACIIGAIGHDHMQYLGKTLDEIAFEKCGIIKRDSYVIMYPDMIGPVENIVKVNVMATYSYLCRNKEINVRSVSVNGTDFTYGKEEYHLKMIGEHQAYNAVCAIEALHHLMMWYPITEETIKRGLAKASWKCRFEVFGKKHDIVIDGAHNLHGIKQFIKTANMCYPDKRKIVVMGMLEEKNYRSSLKEIAKFADTLLITQINSNRQNDVELIYRTAREFFYEAVLFEDNYDAFDIAMTVKKDDAAVFVVGSLYLAGNLRSYVEKFC